MKHTALLCSIFILAWSFLPLHAAQPVPDDEEDPYFLLCGQADKAIADGDYEEAAARLIDAMSVRPAAAENILLMSNLGMVYSFLGRDSLALATLDEAHRMAPAMRTVRANRAHVLLKLGRDKDAMEDYGAVLDADSLNLEARFYHGTIALYSGMLDTAERDFAVLASQDPDGTDTAIALSALYSLTQRNRQAIPYFERLIKIEPSAEYYAALAGCQLADERLSDASATLAEAMKLFPEDPELYYYRAMLNRDRYRLDQAHSDADRAVKLGLNPAKAAELFK